MASEKEGSALPASGLALVLALLLGAFAVRDVSLEHYRPTRAERNTERLIELQDAEARLWQDPFSAVQRHQQELAKALAEKRALAQDALEHHRARHTFEFLQGDIADKQQLGKVVVLGVTVPGGPYADEAERRQRSRYAVLAALNTRGYTPRDGEHLGYVASACDSEPATCDTRLLPEIIPFEWFERAVTPAAGTGAEQRPKDRLLLIWLTEHPLAAAPVTSIMRLVGRLGVDPAKTVVRMLAPFSSDTLSSLAIEAAEHRSGEPQIEIYSATATASADALAQSAGRPLPVCRDKDQPPRGPVCVVRTIATDDMLAKHLIGELNLRGIHPGRHCDHASIYGCQRIALVSEWDTLYGRTLPEAVAKIVCRGQLSCPALLRASYLQGIDGAISGEADPSGAGARRRDAKELTKESARSERADGRHQFDYLRRLVDQLKRENAASQRGYINAIGILGGDVYDKLLVLRALRKEFPHAQFFTTDLDARLLHPEEFKSARNLVVASAFGLELAPHLQKDIPPFRDVYQTSVFYAAQIALTRTDPGPQQAEILQRITPLMFEVGRHSAVQLDGPLKQECDGAAAQACVQPPRPDRVPAWLKNGWQAYPAAALLVILVLLPLYPAIRAAPQQLPLGAKDASPEEQQAHGVARWVNADAAAQALREHRVKSLTWFAAGFGMLLLALHVFAVAAIDQSAEPLRFYEGISVWPTEALRVVGGVLAGFLVYWSILRMRGSHIEMSGWFFHGSQGRRIPEYAADRSGWRGFRKSFGARSRARIFACDLLENQPRCTQSAGGDPGATGESAAAPGRLKSIKTDLFWHACAFHSSVPASLVRTTIAAVLFYLLGFALAWAVGFPHTPFRGNFSRNVDYIAMGVISSPALLFLTFYVVDATLMCKRFISALGEAQTDWPAYTRERYGLGTIPLIGEGGEADAARADLELANDHLIDMRLSAKRTAAVGTLVYYPVLVMLLLLFARSTLFDNWHWPAGIVLPLALAILMLIACIVVLRRAAERARSRALDSVAQRLLPAKGRSNANATVTQLELVLKQIADLREGAFAPVSQQPIIKALLIFFSASGLALLEYFGIVTF